MGLGHLLLDVRDGFSRVEVFRARLEEESANDRESEAHKNIMQQQQQKQQQQQQKQHASSSLFQTLEQFMMVWQR